jgi:hypothetical protein
MDFVKEHPDTLLSLVDAEPLSKDRSRARI